MAGMKRVRMSKRRRTSSAMEGTGKGRKVASRRSKSTMSKEEDMGGMGMGLKRGRGTKRVSRTSTRSTSSARKGGRKVTRRATKR